MTPTAAAEGADREASAGSEWVTVIMVLRVTYGQRLKRERLDADEMGSGGPRRRGEPVGPGGAARAGAARPRAGGGQHAEPDPRLRPAGGRRNRALVAVPVGPRSGPRAAGRRRPRR